MAYAYIVLDAGLFFLVQLSACGFVVTPKHVGLVNLIREVSKMSSRAGEMRLFLKKYYMNESYTTTTLLSYS
jgi:hypothetical protein